MTPAMPKKTLEGFKEIPLTQDKIALVDIADYEWLSEWKWHYNAGYAVRRVYMGYIATIERTKKTAHMHREIMGVSGTTLIDHINGNCLDNRRCNLRISNTYGNARNRRKTDKPRSSKYKGVCWDKRKEKWLANICVNYKRKYLGYFSIEEDAALAYNKAALELHGEFAGINAISLKG